MYSLHTSRAVIFNVNNYCQNKTLKTQLFILNSIKKIKRKFSGIHREEPEEKMYRSKLMHQHRNLLMETVPYDQPQSWIHCSEKYRKKMFAYYGQSSEINPRICFNSNENLVWDETPIRKILKKISEERELMTKTVNNREAELTKKLEKLEEWKIVLNKTITKKEADIQAAKKYRERLIEEVRSQFGYKLDSKDERFKQLLEQKEKADKKKAKDMKRKAKEEKMVTKLLESNSTI